MYTVIFSAAAEKDKARLKQAGLDGKARAILDLLAVNPFQNPPAYEKLQGDLTGFYSRRVNRQHRIVYRVIEDARVVHIARMWTHYEK